MTQAMNTAVQRLARVLEAENTALTAMDFAGAGALLAPKHAAADALAAAMRAASAGEATAQSLQELGALADENRKLLNRAMRVQRRVLDLVAKAARASQPVSRYGASGRTAGGMAPTLMKRI